MSNTKPEEMSKADYAAYQAVKPVTDTIGSVPIAGPAAIGLLSTLCLPSRLITGKDDGICGAISATLDDLNSPAFPKSASSRQDVPTR